MIAVQSVRFSYANSLPLFEDLSLQIPNGGIYGLLGKNGSGKTTLLKILAGLCFPQAGDCRVFDAEPAARNPNFLADLYILPEGLYVPALTAEKYCQCYAPFYPAFDAKMFDEVTKQFEIPHNRLLTQMSHGQKKKFLISFGLATNAKLFIMDEPTNGLDIPSKTLFRQLLAQHFSDERIFIISTHQIHDVQNLLNHIIMLEEGKIIFNQAAAEIALRLTCSRQTSEPRPGEYLYYEKKIGGYIVLSESRGQESEIDLEVLFNALLTNPAAFKKIFDKEK